MFRDNLLFVGSETRCYALDYSSFACKEIDLSHMDNKYPTCVELFSQEPFIALGCSDGAIVMWNVESWTFEKRVLHYHKPIVALHSYNVGSNSFLIGFYSDSTVYKWRVTGQDLTMESKSDVKGSPETQAVSYNAAEKRFVITTDKYDCHKHQNADQIGE